MKTSGEHSSEHDQERSPQNTTDAPENPTRRNMLKRVGIGIAGAALAYYGLSRLGRDGRGGGARPVPAPGSMTYRTNPKNGDRISLLGYGCMRLGMLQPALTFERGYCRVNCTDCSQVCPTGAIKPVTVEEKSSIQIGRAIIDRERCIRKSDNVECTTCIKNCPAGVITAIEKEDGTKDIAVDEEKCVGCGACEYFCPVRPAGAIIVVGNVEHRRI